MFEPTRIRRNASWWPRWLVVGVVAGFLLALAPSASIAAKPPKGPPWLKLDRVEAEPSWIDGVVRLRVYVSAIKLAGGTIDIQGKKAWTLQVGKSKKRFPNLAGTFRAVEDDVAITIVINTTTGFAEELPEIKAAVRALLERLPKTAQVAIIGYGEDIDGDRRHGSVSKALSALDDLDAETVPTTEPQLIKATEKALRTFRKLKPSEPGRSIRKLVLVISDGLDQDHDKARFRKAARNADRDNIRIHTVAYSRDNYRAPMLGLAELSKRTFGTFRLARNKSSFGAQLTSFGDEIEKQYVLTYLVPEEVVRGKKLSILAQDLTSNQIKLKNIRCGKEDCESGQYCARGTCVTRSTDSGGGILGWIMIIGGGIVGLLVLLLLVGFVLTRRQHKKEAHAALFHSIAQGEQPAADNRIVPQGPQGGQVAPTAPRGAAPVGRVTGQPAPGHVAPQAAAPRAAAPRAASLFMVKGDRQGQYLPIRHGFRIGKAADCDLVLTDGFASGHHCHLEIDKGGNVTLVDDRSTNGTFVNGVRANRNRLTHGMLIKIGQTEIRFMQG